ncbi:rho guanine nucleotide exchange factor 15-like [Megalops cyprinoides]|uniref:rho guanine nucleotide exchange factor 15-like n=1 Tax=Megalops cyprinoides TaxID=118141 RepID=UPI0018651463|nr:rho guanine nucleotide exchange factor 15-like [Megalops cyprinoides]
MPVSGQEGRSAPDGREVEAGEDGKAERQHDSAVSSILSCEKGCVCVCHQERPNMRLVWVPVNKTEEEQREESEEENKERHEGDKSGGQKKIKSVSSREKLRNDMVQDEKNKIQQGSDMTTIHEDHQHSMESPQNPTCNKSSQAVTTSYHVQPQPTLHNSAEKRMSSHQPVKPPQLAQSTGPSCNLISKVKDEGGNVLIDCEKVDLDEEERPPVPHTRKKSTDLEIRLQDEPLYQAYRDTVITKEIQRQAVCHDIRKASVDPHVERDGAPRDGVRMRAESKATNTPAQSTLWQDLTMVRESGILGKLSPTECQRQESMFEVLTSEASYLRSLRVLTDHFLESRDLDETLIIRDKKTLFSNILRVREVSERFLKDLEQRVDESPFISDICDIIHYHAQHNFSVYIDYIRNQIYQEKTYNCLMQKNVQFATVISRLQDSELCQRLPFMSFLLLPFQRITRIKMLIENILKRTQEGTNEEHTASKALGSVSQIIQECNTQVGKMKQMEELIHIAQMLEFQKLKAIPVISQTRFLEKRGELLELTKGGTLFSPRHKMTPIYLFLFNDLLIFTCKKSSERYIVTDHAHRSLVHVRAVGQDKRGTWSDRCFSLIQLENHQGCTYERLLKAPTQSDMHRWMAAFPNLIDQERDKEEVVYEDWDCPQVQCVDQYVAQQSDELDLEPTDIINVVRKTNEGWYEGVRLSDGQKGWFPADKVQEITNEHVRRRNLREQYRIIRAAAQIVPEEPGQASGLLYQNT